MLTGCSSRTANLGYVRWPENANLPGGSSMNRHTARQLAINNPSTSLPPGSCLASFVVALKADLRAGELILQCSLLRIKQAQEETDIQR